MDGGDGRIRCMRFRDGARADRAQRRLQTISSLRLGDKVNGTHPSPLTVPRFHMCTSHDNPRHPLARPAPYSLHLPTEHSSLRLRLFRLACILDAPALPHLISPRGELRPGARAAVVLLGNFSQPFEFEQWWSGGGWVRKRVDERGGAVGGVVGVRFGKGV